MALPTHFRFDDPPVHPHVAAPLPTTAAIDAERLRLARLTARGLGMPIAGMLFWIAVAVLVRTLPLKAALFWSFCATGAVFPVGTVLTRWFGGDLFAKSPSLTPLAMLMNGMQLMYWPIILLVWSLAPAWVPYAMATLFGTHFLGYAWLYRSRGYAVLSLGVSVLLTAAVLIMRDPLVTTVPLLAAAVYAVAVAFLVQEWRDVR